MAKYYDIDTSVRINGGLTVNGDTSIPSSYNLYVGGNITGNSNLYIIGTITGNTINGATANIANINSTGTISGGTIKGNGASLVVNGTTANGGTSPISNGWAYAHENKIGSQGHIPTGGSTTTFLRGDNTWVVPTDTNNYDTGISSTSGGNGTLTISRNGLSALTLNLAHDHNSIYYTQAQSDAKYLGISANAVSASNANLLDNIDSSQFLRSDQDDTMGGILTISGSGATPLVLQRNGSPNVNLEFLHSSGSGFLGIDLTGQLKFGSVADLNASGYTVWHSNNFVPSNKLDTTTFNTHTGNTGVGAHIPVGGSTSQFLRGDGTWATPTDTDSYVTGLSSTSGGNGTLTVSRNNGLSNLTLDLSHNHDSSYYTKSQIDTQMGGKDYYGKWNLLVSGVANGITASANVTVTGGGATSVSYLNGTLTISSTDTNTWRGIDTSPVSGDTTNSIASSWAYAHANSYGMGSHVPTGGSATTFLRGDNTWAVPTDTNNYDTGISSTSGGNGTLTISRNGLSNLTLDLTHNHDSSYYTKSQIDTQMSGKDYYGKWTMNVGGTGYAVNSSGNITVTGNGATTVSMSSGTITVSSTDTNTWRPIDATPTSGDTANSISSDWAYQHVNSYGLGSHVPTGGTVGKFLQGDGTWQTVSTTDTYVTGISSTSGGNGTLTVSRNNGQSNLTLDLTHNHDSSYYTKSQIDTQMSGKDYYGKWNLIVGGTTNGITASANVTVTGGGATSVSYAGGTMTITSTDTNTWRPVDTTPTSGATGNSIASSWAYTHANTYGLGSHVPTGGTTGKYLQGDGTWATPTDTYVTGLSSTAGGNGTLTVTRNTGGNLTIDLSHTHSQYVANNATNQAVGSGFIMSGNAYVGGSSSNGALYIRSGTGTTAMQFAGDNSAQASGVTIYMNASGNANFGGTVSANALVVASTSLVNNLNAQMINSIKEPQIAKNQSINDLGGKGVQTGMLVSAQSVPNMTVQIANGTVYTNSGMRIVVSSATNVSFSAPSATYNRIDSVYVQGSSAGANEGVITVAQGTAQATPVAPSIPSDGVLLANVTIRQNAGSILATDIADARVWKPVYTSGSDVYATNKLFVQGALDSTNGNITVNQPFKFSNSAKNLTITSGNTSVTWTHNLNLTNYAVSYSCDNPEPHIYWSNKSGNSIVFNLDDVCSSDVHLDVILVAL